MKKLLSGVLVLFALTGCQSKEETAPQAAGGQEVVAPERVEGARKLVAQALDLLNQKDYKGCVASLDAAIRMNPGDQDPYLILGQILLKAGEFQRAKEFLDGAASRFPNNGGLFYMLSIANKMSGKKLPAVLAARRSFEIYKEANDTENAEKSAVLLQQIINSPDPDAPKAYK